MKIKILFSYICLFLIKLDKCIITFQINNYENSHIIFFINENHTYYPTFNTYLNYSLLHSFSDIRKSQVGNKITIRQKRLVHCFEYQTDMIIGNYHLAKFNLYMSNHFIYSYGEGIGLGLKISR